MRKVFFVWKKRIGNKPVNKIFVLFLSFVKRNAVIAFIVQMMFQNVFIRTLCTLPFFEAFYSSARAYLIEPFITTNIFPLFIHNEHPFLDIFIIPQQKDECKEIKTNVEIF